MQSCVQLQLAGYSILVLFHSQQPQLLIVGTAWVLLLKNCKDGNAEGFMKNANVDMAIMAVISKLELKLKPEVTIRCYIDQ